MTLGTKSSSLLSTTTPPGVTIFTVVRPAPRTSGDTIPFLFDYGSYTARGFGLALGAKYALMYTPINHGGVVSLISPCTHCRGTEGIVVVVKIEFVAGVGGLGNQLVSSFNGSTSEGNIILNRPHVVNRFSSTEIQTDSDSIRGHFNIGCPSNSGEAGA
jgi:hypothetical protein